MLENKVIVLFDGVCNLCNATVQFLIVRDKKDQLRFASLQSEFGQKVLEKYHLPQKDFDSFVLLVGDKVYLRSSAALKVSAYLGVFWKVFQIFWLLPKPFRDWVYNFVAKNRYKWFGKKDECMLPSPQLKAKFFN
ncbi:MAG: thiol-disulfide oxidoreductase DCC family protein [Thermonemataceae bacterium]|nr:thiol-disulfide oxidoreductase DCC family protein [Thermonemataceae bacterium]